MDLFLVEFDVVLDVPDDEPSKSSERTNEEAKAQPRESKKDPEDAATPEGSVFRLFFDDISQVSPDPSLLLTKGCAGFGSSSTHSANLGIYVPE